MSKKCTLLFLFSIPAVAPAFVASGSSSSMTAPYAVDGGHSSVVFRVKHLDVAYFYGRFNDISGSYTLNGDDASFDITIKAESVDSNSEKRDNHLRSPDFFNVKQYPTIRFKSSSSRQTGRTTYEVNGELTLHGVTRPLTVNVEKTGDGPGMRGEYRSGFETMFTIKRSDFDMKFLLDNLGDEIRVIVSVEGIKQ